VLRHCHSDCGPSHGSRQKAGRRLCEAPRIFFCRVAALGAPFQIRELCAERVCRDRCRPAAPGGGDKAGQLYRRLGAAAWADGSRRRNAVAPPSRGRSLRFCATPPAVAETRVSMPTARRSNAAKSRGGLRDRGITPAGAKLLCRSNRPSHGRRGASQPRRDGNTRWPRAASESSSGPQRCCGYISHRPRARARCARPVGRRSGGRVGAE